MRRWRIQQGQRMKKQFRSLTCCLTAIVLAGILLAGSHLNGLQPTAGSQHPYAVDKALPEPVIFGAGVISTGEDESHPAFMPDGKTLYFLKNAPRFDHWTMVVSRFQQGRWRTPAVAPFSGQCSDADPFITPDGGKFFFISTRPVDGKAAGQPKEDTDIWMMERTAAGWGAPQHLGATVNSPTNEWFPTVTRDGTLYFGSERAGGHGATDLWRARLVD